MSLIHAFLSPSAMSLSTRMFLAFMGRIRAGHLTLVTPEGAQYVFGEAHRYPAATLRILDWRACGAILRAGDIGFAHAYREGWIDSPDLAALLRVAIRNEDAMTQTVTGNGIARLWYGVRHRLRLNSRAGSRRNIHAHYDLGNAFYGLWLDRTWTYSSAWFDGETDRSLEEAQAAKYQRIVDTLELRPGMRVLEIGCGWGGFAMHAARQGIHVDALTISDQQYEFAVQQVDREGLSNRVHIQRQDYRDVRAQYDAIVSIEMFEAVGEAYWPSYFETLKRCLKRGGRALVQSITIDESRFDAYRNSSDFIREYIFPGGMLPSPERFIDAAQKAGMHGKPSLSFGLDYALTLRRWLETFDAHQEAVRALGFDETFIRTWRLYLQYCEAGFIECRTDVMHFVVTHGA